MSVSTRNLKELNPKPGLRLKVLSNYLSHSKLPFDSAKQKAEREGGKLISLKHGLGLVRSLATLHTSETTVLEESGEGTSLKSPSFSCFFEEMKRDEVISILSYVCPFWCNALKLDAPDDTAVMDSKGFSMSNSPDFQFSKRTSIILDDGTWDSTIDTNGKRICSIIPDSKPLIFHTPSSSLLNLFLDSNGDLTDTADFSKRITDPTIPVFTSIDSMLRPLICAITPTSFNRKQKLIIRVATLPPQDKMGIIMELPKTD